MGRERRDFVRRSGFRDATLFVIASEGDVTEPRYFNGLKDRWHSSRIHIEVMRRDDATTSSPVSVLGSLDQHATTYHLRNGDQLWLVIDRDSQSWKLREMAAVARACQQKNYHLAVSNPCFELWLLLHFDDLPRQTAERKNRVRRIRVNSSSARLTASLRRRWNTSITSYLTRTARSRDPKRLTQVQTSAGHLSSELATIGSLSNFSPKPADSLSSTTGFRRTLFVGQALA